MDISRSPEGPQWTGGALVYSGRRDPVWPVSADLGHRLEHLWGRLPAWSGAFPRPAPLGYRGCRLTAPDGRTWTAFGELVTLAPDSRRDTGRQFESSLVASAPPDVQSALRPLLT